VFLGVCLVVRVWGASKATRARVEGVVLVFVRVGQGGYSDGHDYHHYHHFHPSTSSGGC